LGILSTGELYSIWLEFATDRGRIRDDTKWKRAMANATSVKEVFDNLCSRFQADKAGSDSAMFRFDLSGDGGGQYWAHIDKGSCRSGAGEPPGTPDITVLATGDDFVKMVNGEIQPMMAFMQGKLKVQGNMGIALKLVNWFDMT
jgi:putative sterol carrier protein